MSTQNHDGYYHATPGRLRVRVSGLKNRKDVAKSLEILMVSQPGITHVRANTVTGNVLIHFNERDTYHQAVLASLADLGHTPLACENKMDCSVDADAICDLGIALGKNLAKVALKQALAGSSAAIILELL